MALQEIWNKLNNEGRSSDKGNIHSYIPVYEEILAPYRYLTDKNVLEIGIFKGDSLLMWEKYFSGDVYGIDCDEQPHGGLADLRPMIAEGTHNIAIGDATSEADIDKFYGGMKFSVVFDDGNHLVSSQLKTIELFKNRMDVGGLICIEDIQSLDETRTLFENCGIGKKIEIVDLREKKGRYDDVIVLIYF